MNFHVITVLRTVTFAALILSFASQKEGCSHLNHFLTQRNSKCFTAERTFFLHIFSCRNIMIELVFQRVDRSKFLLRAQEF